MNESSTLTDALLAAGAIVIFFYVVVRCLHRVVVWARRRSKRAYVIGAALAPFMALGNVSDPDFRILHEAKRLKNREDDDSGDPPDTEDERERIVRAAAEIAAKRYNIVPKEDAVAVAARPIRPALVWLISLALGFMASVASLVLTWLLFAEPALLAPQARFVRESLSALDWASLFVMSVTLLTSMVMLFRLRKSSVHLFALYVAFGMLGVAWYAMTPRQESYFDVRVTLFVGVPVAIAVLLYMLRLKKRAVLA
jgi:hypothetical protein